MIEKILILDFGSQFTQLIARRIRELNVYSEIHPYNKIPEIDDTVKGIILSGSPCSVNDLDAPFPNLEINALKIPVLGLCYGAQWLAKSFGGEVSASSHREYGRSPLVSHSNSIVFESVSQTSVVWMSHGDTITKLPPNFEAQATTENGTLAAFKIKDKPIFGLQFHPEVTHTEDGKLILQNFIVNVCGCQQSWTPDNFIHSTVDAIKEQVGADVVILGLSGGVDSTVAAKLIQEAIGVNLVCIFIDNGLLRKNEYENVLLAYKDLGLNIVAIRAGDKFLSQLKGISDPEKKTKSYWPCFC